MPIKEFLRKFATLCHIARSILNRCERVTLLRKDLQGLMKRQALIWVDSRLCVSGNGEFGGKVFLREQKVIFREIDSFG